VQDRMLNVLLVEDDDVDVMNVRRAFKKNHIANPLWVAGNGLEALEILRGDEMPRDRRLILLDLNMPRMNGLEFLRELRADPELHGTPVVVLTTSDDERDRVEAYNLNCGRVHSEAGHLYELCRGDGHAQQVLDAGRDALRERRDMEASKPNRAQDDVPQDRRVAPLRLLIVDDDQVDRMTVRRGLHSMSVQAEFEEAQTFREAVASLKDRAFDCAFLDFRLPGGDGLQVLREVRGAGIRTPIVMLTGQGDEQLAVELMKAGASDYLPKGAVTPERLAQSLRYALRVHHAEMAARNAEAAREDAIAARGRFYAAMSHELRTPINAIIGYNELLLSSIYGPLAPDQERGIARSQRAARHLLELVNDVLDLSKLEAGKMDLQVEEVSMPALIDDLFTTIRPLANDHGCELTLDDDDCPDRITTDPRRVRQILLNLLSNAIKFGRGQPVEVRCAASDDGGVVIEVEDHGPGVAQVDLSRIFEEFVQLGSGEQTGTGLGLPISRRLADLLGGSLSVVSEVDSGCIFQLVLPAAIEEEVDVFPSTVARLQPTATD